MVESGLSVVPLSPELLDSWRRDLESRWVQFRTESGRFTTDEASTTVTRIIDKRLMDGVETTGQFIFELLDDGVSKGYFWIEIKEERGFLYDVVLHEEIELSRMASLIEEVAVARGAFELRSNIFSGDNLLARLTLAGKFLTISSQMWLLDDPMSTPRATNPSLSVRKMRQDEFPDYYQRQIDLYAEEKVVAGKCAPTEAFLESKEEMAKLLPDGLNSDDQFIFVAELQNQRVGTVWVDIDRELDVPRAFGLHIEIEPALRGQGLGRDLMLATQVECRKLGAKGFALSVFGHNAIARNLYESFGFVVTEEMKKKVLADPESIRK